MSAEPCTKCGELRKVDNIFDKGGWQQPPCYNCGDPEYYEPFGSQEAQKEEMEFNLRNWGPGNPAWEDLQEDARNRDMETQTQKMARDIRYKIDEQLLSLPRGMFYCLHDDPVFEYFATEQDPDKVTMRMTQKGHFIKSPDECTESCRKTQYGPR